MGGNDGAIVISVGPTVYTKVIDAEDVDAYLVNSPWVTKRFCAREV
jgi:hypothetical protein